MALTLTGDQGTVTITSGPWALTNGTSGDIDKWVCTFTRKANRTRPFGWILPKVTLGPLEGEGYIEFDGLDGQTPALPAVPATTYGTLLLGTKSSTQNYEGKAAFFNLQSFPIDSTAGSNQRWRMQFVFTAENSTDTIDPD